MRRKKKIIITTKPSITQDKESKFLASVAVALPTLSVVVDYSEETQAINSSSPHTMVATSLSLQEDTINLVKAAWEAEA